MAKELQVVFGNLGKSSATAVVFSLSNEDVTLVVAGKPYTVTMPIFGNDRPAPDLNGDINAGYVGDVDVTNLPEFEEITWAATQASKSDSGRFHTSGSQSSDFALVFGTCHNNTKNNDVIAWDVVQAYMEDPDSLPVLSAIMIDDIFYADAANNLNDGDSCAQGKTVYSRGGPDRTEYDYGLSYLTWAGLLDGFPVNSMEGADYESWRYVLNNTTVMVGAGDHEYSQDIWSTDYTIVPNKLHKTLNGFDGVAHNVYNQCMRPLHGDSIASTYANGMHWAKSFGGVKLIVSDVITNSIQLTTQWLGADQITDLLTAAESLEPMKVICRPAESYRTSSILPGKEYASPNESENLFIKKGTTPKSLMENPRCNGLTGNFIAVRGDWHTGISYKYSAPETGTLAKENFIVNSLNTVSGSAGGLSSILASDIDLAATTENIEMIGGTYRVAGETPIESKSVRSYITILEYRGSGKDKTTTVKQYTPIQLSDGTSDDATVNPLQPQYKLPAYNITDKNGTVWGLNFSRKFVQHNDNAGFDLDEDPDYTLPVAFSESGEF